MGVAYTLGEKPLPTQTEEKRFREKAFIAIEWVEESTAPEGVEFNELLDGEEALIMVELEEMNIFPDWGNLARNISIPLRSGIVGLELSPDHLSLAFFHASTYFLFNEESYASILECPVVPVYRDEPVHREVADVLLGSVLPNLPNHCISLPLILNDNAFPIPIYTAAKKRYKPVHQCTVPVPTMLPEKFCVIRQFPSDPLEHLPTLNPILPPFTPTGQYTQECKEIIDNAHNQSFLWLEEMKAIHHLMMLQEGAFTWNKMEKGQFKHEYFLPVEMPVIEHIPWRVPVLPIPPGLMDEVIKVVKDKIFSGIYEPSNLSYRSRWFTVVKKDGKSLWIVHDLQPLNAVMIRDSSVIPILAHLAEWYTCHAILAALDIFVGYDEQFLAICSRNLTTFQTPLGPFRLTAIPMGWTNSIQIFHRDVTFLNQPEIPEYTIPYLDNVNVHGGPTC